jgi:hypothetical protein
MSPYIEPQKAKKRNRKAEPTEIEKGDGYVISSASKVPYILSRQEIIAKSIERIGAVRTDPVRFSVI